jgi:hypothetical protein
MRSVDRIVGPVNADRHKESVKGENTQNGDVKGRLEFLTCDNPAGTGNWNAYDVDEDTGIFAFSLTTFDNCPDNNLAVTALPHEAEMLGIRCYRRPT